ncbi:MAG: ROK family protein [Planctomycetaceae bacterium]|jgi:glucokinase|nr:ROK family protein [Planctomycetaceae bacterium]
MSGTTTEKKDSMQQKHYIGVDVGGTKIQTSLVTEAGVVLASHRQGTPRKCGADVTLQALEDSIKTLLQEQDIHPKDLAGIGIAVPGTVQQETGYIVETPNMNLSGIDLGSHMKSLFDIPVAIGNDCNLGTLGECWLGSGRNAASCVGIFIGTGIGSGIVINNTVLSGAGQAAGEIGHIVVQTPCEDWRQILQRKQKKVQKSYTPSHLPQCGCGNYGCLESLASRIAIERFIREALQNKEQSAIKELNGGSLEVIKSGSLAKALKADDHVVKTIMYYVSHVIGHACLTVRHLLDPEVIVLGGGVMEACQKFMMPIIEGVVINDRLMVVSSKRRLLLSSLGDNAVVLGAVALVRSAGGSNPLQQKTRRAIPHYPTLHLMADNVIHIADRPYMEDFFLLPDGSIQPRTKLPKKDEDGFRLKDLETATQGGADLLILMSPKAGELTLSGKCHDYLYRRNIDYRILPLEEGVKLYNSAAIRRAAVVHFGCDGK